MIRHENHCVGCEPWICNGGCSLIDVEVAYCDNHPEENAVCCIEGEDMCCECAKKFLLEAVWDKYSIPELAELLEAPCELKENGEYNIDGEDMCYEAAKKYITELVEDNYWLYEIAGLLNLAFEFYE